MPVIFAGNGLEAARVDRAITPYDIAPTLSAYLGVKPPEPFLAEMGLRFSQVYFLFFAVLWFLSRPRSTMVSIVTFVVAMGLITLYDLARYSGLGDEAKGFVQPSWLIPGIYMAAMTLLPIFTRLNVEKPVPERVTK